MNNQPLVSVIIPTKNSSKTLEACLESVKNQTYENPSEKNDSHGTSIEIIVVDNNSTDQTKKIAKKYTDKVFNKGPERSAQRNFGAKKAKGDYFLFIDSDMKLTKNVVKSCVQTAIKNNQIKGVIIPEESFGEGFWSDCKKLERSFYVGINWIEAARFYPKTIFNQVGGFDERMTGPEDWDLSQRIKEKYGKEAIRRIKSFIYHNEGNLSLINTLKKKIYYSQKLGIYKETEVNKEHFKKQINIIERYKLFLSHPKKLFKNPILGIGMLFMKTVEFIAGGIGYLLK